jgi:hypothetical protein
MATDEDVQRIALALPGSTLDPRSGRMTFSRQRIFAVLPGNGTLLVRLDLKTYAATLNEQPNATAPFKGRGPKGLVVVQLAEVDTEFLERGLRAAWEQGQTKPGRRRRTLPA